MIHKGSLSSVYILACAVGASSALKEQRDLGEQLLSCSGCATEIKRSERAYRRAVQPCCRVSATSLVLLTRGSAVLSCCLRLRRATPVLEV
jgi:hypothetical protein